MSLLSPLRRTLLPGFASSFRLHSKTKLSKILLAVQSADGNEMVDFVEDNGTWELIDFVPKVGTKSVRVCALDESGVTNILLIYGLK